MQLSLSVRIAEDFKVKDRTRMDFGELARMAARCGYDAICMRASQAGVRTEAGRLKGMRAQLDELGLGVTMVTGDVPLAANDENAGLALRDIGPYLDLADSNRCFRSTHGTYLPQPNRMALLLSDTHRQAPDCV